MEEQLIELFRNNPGLFNKHHKEGSPLRKRNEKLAELSKKLRVPVRKLKDRWRTLRDTYQKEKKRLDIEPNAKRKWKWMDQMGFLEESFNCSEEQITETSKEFLDETCTAYDKTSSSFNDHFNNDEDVNINDDYNNTSDGDCGGSRVKILKANIVTESLLMPIDQNRKRKYIKQKIKTEAHSETNSISIEDEDEELLMDIKTDESRPLENNVIWQPSPSLPKRSCIKLFCDSLAVQIEEANLTSYQFASLQIEFLKKLQEYLPKNK